MKSSETDITFLKRLNSRDHEAFKQLFREYFQDIAYYSGRMCQNHGTRDARLQQHRNFHPDRSLFQYGQVTKTTGYITIEKNGFPGTIRATRAFPATK